MTIEDDDLPLIEKRGCWYVRMRSWQLARDHGDIGPFKDSVAAAKAAGVLEKVLTDCWDQSGRDYAMSED